MIQLVGEVLAPPTPAEPCLRGTEHAFLGAWRRAMGQVALAACAKWHSVRGRARATAGSAALSPGEPVSVPARYVRPSGTRCVCHLAS